MLKQLEATSSEMMTSALASIQDGLGPLWGSSDATSQPQGSAERSYHLEALTDFARVSGTLLYCVIVVHSAQHAQAHAQHASVMPLPTPVADGFLHSILRLLEAPGLSGLCPELAVELELVGRVQLFSDALVAASAATMVNFEQRLLEGITVSTAQAVCVTSGGGSFKRARDGAERHLTPTPTPVLSHRVDLQLNAAGAMLARLCRALPLLQGELTTGGATAGASQSLPTASSPSQTRGSRAEEAAENGLRSICNGHSSVNTKAQSRAASDDNTGCRLANTASCVSITNSHGGIDGVNVDTSAAAAAVFTTRAAWHARLQATCALLEGTRLSLGFPAAQESRTSGLQASGPPIGKLLQGAAAGILPAKERSRRRTEAGHAASTVVFTYLTSAAAHCGMQPSPASHSASSFDDEQPTCGATTTTATLTSAVVPTTGGADDASRAGSTRRDHPAMGAYNAAVDLAACRLLATLHEEAEWFDSLLRVTVANQTDQNGQPAKDAPGKPKLSKGVLCSPSETWQALAAAAGCLEVALKTKDASGAGCFSREATATASSGKSDNDILNVNAASMVSRAGRAEKSRAVSSKGSTVREEERTAVAMSKSTAGACGTGSVCASTGLHRTCEARSLGNSLDKDTAVGSSHDTTADWQPDERLVSQISEAAQGMIRQADVTLKHLRDGMQQWLSDSTPAVPNSLSERTAAELKRRWGANRQEIVNRTSLPIGHSSFRLAATGASILATLAVHRVQPSALQPEKAMAAMMAALEHLASDPRGGTAATIVATLGDVCPGLAALCGDYEFVRQSMGSSSSDCSWEGLRKKLEHRLAVVGAAGPVEDLQSAEAPLRKAMASLAVVTEAVLETTSGANNVRASPTAETVLAALLVGFHGFCPILREAKVCRQHRSPQL